MLKSNIKHLFIIFGITIIRMITSTTAAFSFHCRRQTISKQRFTMTQMMTPTKNNNYYHLSFSRYRKQPSISYHGGMNTNGVWMNHNKKKNYNSWKTSLQSQTKDESSSSGSNNNYSLVLEIETPQDMEEVGGILSMNTCAGDVLLLGGDLGAGKTCFSRGFVRARTGLIDLSITSPTYLLSNTYPTDSGQTLYVLHSLYTHNYILKLTLFSILYISCPKKRIHHMDLYRLSGTSNKEFGPLDLENALANGMYNLYLFLIQSTILFISHLLFLSSSLLLFYIKRYMFD